MVVSRPQIVSIMVYFGFFVIFDVKKAKPGILDTFFGQETVISRHHFVATVLEDCLKITRAEGDIVITLGCGVYEPKQAQKRQKTLFSSSKTLGAYKPGCKRKLEVSFGEKFGTGLFNNPAKGHCHNLEKHPFLVI